MTRQQLPPQIRKLEVIDKRTKKVRPSYELIMTTNNTGKRKQIRRRYRTEQEARTALAEFSDQVNKQVFTHRAATTVTELADDWIVSLHGIRQSTVHGYEYCLAPLKQAYGEQSVQRITRSQLDRLLGWLRTGGTTTEKGNVRKAWSARSLNKCIDVWGRLFAYAMERGELGRNPVTGMRRVERPLDPMKTFTPAEIREVLTTADGYRAGHLCYLALSGLRRGEISGLKWTDIDFVARLLHIRRNRTEVAGVVQPDGPTKTRSSVRTLPLPDDVHQALRIALKRQKVERMAAGRAYRHTGYVLINEVGEPYAPHSLTRLWLSIIGNAEDVPRITLHEARHSCATALHLRGVPLAVIAAWLGHANASVTAKIYSHSQPHALADAAKVLASLA